MTFLRHCLVIPDENFLTLNERDMILLHTSRMLERTRVFKPNGVECIDARRSVTEYDYTVLKHWLSRPQILL